MTEQLSTAQEALGCFAPGDVIEISTASGLAYLQVTHLHSAYPEIVRALPGLHTSRPESLDLLVQLPTRFIVITPLAGSLRHGHLNGGMLGNWPVPNGDRDFPQFRTPIHDPNGQIVYCWYWDGDTLHHTSSSDHLNDLPIREVVLPEELLIRLVNDL